MNIVDLISTGFSLIAFCFALATFYELWKMRRD